MLRKGHLSPVRTYKKTRLPVFSRLTLAWSGAALIGIIGAGVFVHAAIYGNGGERIALPVGTIENFARGATQSPNTTDAPYDVAPPSGGLRLGAPRLRGGDDEPTVKRHADERAHPDTEDGDVEDILLIPEEDYASLLPDEYDDDTPITDADIIITIPGSTSQSRGAHPPQLASLNRGEVITPIPDPTSALLEDTVLGKIPKIAADGRRSMQVFARKSDAASNSPRVAMVVGGLGLDPILTERIINTLPADVSLAFAPYAKDLPLWTKKARNAGHEVLIELPMESYGGNAQALGAAALLTTRTTKENLQRLDWLMSRFGGYFAATNYLGGKLSAKDDAIAPILKRLNDAGVAYIDDTGAARPAARNARVPIATVNRIIPPAQTDSARAVVRRELASLEKIAQRDGIALGKTYAYDISVEELITWYSGLNERGVGTAPASRALQSPRAAR